MAIVEVLDACRQAAFQKAVQIYSVINQSSARLLELQPLQVARTVWSARSLGPSLGKTFPAEVLLVTGDCLPLSAQQGQLFRWTREGLFMWTPAIAKHFMYSISFNSDCNPVSCRQFHCHFTGGHIEAYGDEISAGRARSATQTLCSSPLAYILEQMFGPRKTLNCFEPVLKNWEILYSRKYPDFWILLKNQEI